MSTYNICFHGEIRKIFTWVLLSAAMVKDYYIQLCHLVTSPNENPHSHWSISVCNGLVTQSIFALISV